MFFTFISYLSLILRLASDFLFGFVHFRLNSVLEKAFFVQVKKNKILLFLKIIGMKRFLCVKKGLNVRFLSYLLRALHANNILKDFK